MSTPTIPGIVGDCSPEGLAETIAQLAHANAHAAELMAELELTRRELEERNRELHKKILDLARAEALTAARGQFLSNVGHELRTPMLGVTGMVELLLEGDLDPVRRGYAEMIRSSATRLVSLIDDLLDLSQVEAGCVVLASAPFDPVQVASEVVSAHAAEAFVPVTMRAAADTPTCIVGDPARFRRVLDKLVGNGVKFTRAGDLALRLWPAVGDAGETLLHVEVADTGIGVAPADVARLFQPSSQLDASSTRAFGGLGLGLVIARHFVELMGDTIGVRSQPGVGSTFWFTVRAAFTPAPTR